MANIMIVDDSLIIRQRLRSILEEQGHFIVCEAKNGKEAIAFYKDKGHEIDLITMDIEMPGINGIEVVQLIREHNPSAVIVMISSIEERGKVFDAIKRGAKHYIVKPFLEDRVREVIHDVLGQDGSHSAPMLKEATVSDDKMIPVHSNNTSGFIMESIDSLPFELFHMDERTILLIRRSLRDFDVPVLFRSLQGLLYFRKMKFVVEFWEPVEHLECSQMLFDFIHIVRERQGQVAIVTDDARYYAHLLSKLMDEVYRTYKDITW